jgi:S-DNA-T family DNA segregation ATPase FtsK/SpoIIIE
MLVAGATGTGKSVCSNSIITSLLLKFPPDELRLIMVDPKIVEFEAYKTLPHLLTPIINDSAKVPIALRWAANEMDNRYRIMAKVGVKKLSEFNNRPRIAEPEFDDDGKQIPEKMPYLVIILDELADLMMTEAKKDVETNIARIAQKGRAAGIHIIVATQRPDAKIVTGVIKANLPTRLCFQVRSLVDSRVVLDAMGAEKLLGMGDMLAMTPSSMELERDHPRSYGSFGSVSRRPRGLADPCHRKNAGLLQICRGFHGRGYGGTPLHRLRPQYPHPL